VSVAGSDPVLKEASFSTFLVRKRERAHAEEIEGLRD